MILSDQEARPWGRGTSVEPWLYLRTRVKCAYRTATVQTTHARLFVAVATLARHAARCLPSITSLINLTLVQYEQVI